MYEKLDIVYEFFQFDGASSARPILFRVILYLWGEQNLVEQTCLLYMGEYTINEN